MTWNTSTIYAIENYLQVCPIFLSNSKLLLGVIDNGHKQHHVDGQYRFAETDYQVDHSKHSLCNDHRSGQSAKKIRIIDFNCIHKRVSIKTSKYTILINLYILGRNRPVQEMLTFLFSNIQHIHTSSLKMTVILKPFEIYYF